MEHNHEIDLIVTLSNIKTPLYDNVKEKLLTKNVTYHPNGIIKEKCEVNPEGMLARYTIYCENGKLKTEYRYKDGYVIYTIIRYPDNSLYIEKHIENYFEFDRPFFHMDQSYTLIPSNGCITMITKYTPFKSGGGFFDCKFYDSRGHVVYHNKFVDNSLQMWVIHYCN